MRIPFFGGGGDELFLFCVQKWQKTYLHLCNENDYNFSMRKEF